MKVYVIITEGYTDCALIEAILHKYMKFEQYQNKNDMPDCLQRQVGKYPGALGELSRDDSPHFFHQGEIAVMVKTAKGISGIGKKISDILEGVLISDDADMLKDVLIICDADLHTTMAREKEIERQLIDAEIHVDAEHKTLQWDVLNMDYCIHVIPQSENGAVEKLLLQVADELYPELNRSAERYKTEIMGANHEKLRKDWATDVRTQEFYADKVQLGAVAAVLKPDRPIGYVVKDCLIRSSKLEDMKQIEEFRKLYEFLEENL